METHAPSHRNGSNAHFITIGVLGRMDVTKASKLLIQVSLQNGRGIAFPGTGVVG